MIKKVFLSFILFLPLFISCSKEKIHEKNPIVLVTIPPYEYIVKRIAGDKVLTQSLVPPNVNLHIFEPTPKLVEQSAQAAVWFRIDEPFEKKIVTTFKERHPKQVIINLQHGIHLLHGDEVELSPCIHEHAHAGGDLHTWMSPKNMMIQAQVINETLEYLFPAHRDVFRKNLLSLKLDLEHLDSFIKNRLERLKGEAILVSHPSLGYFCKEYGLVQLSVECEGKEPRPRDIEEILNKARTYRVNSVFTQKGYNNQGAILIGKKLNVPVFEIEPYGEDYIHNLQSIAEIISRRISP